MAVSLTPKEHQMLTAVFQEMGEIPNVDFNKVAAITGQKYAKNARSAFKRLWDKLKEQNESGPVQEAGSGDEYGAVDAPKSKVKATPKKGVGQRKAPTKATGTGRKSKRPTKKEREAAAALKAEAEAKTNTKAESDGDADGEGDTTGMTAAEGAGDGESGGEDCHASHAGSPVGYHENRESDEISANLLGITVEEFRKSAEETYGNGYAPTPKGYVGSEDEA